MKGLALLGVGFALAIAIVLCMAFAGVGDGGLTAMGLGIGAMALLRKDKLLERSTALPNGATTASATGWDLQHNSTGDFHAQCEVAIEAPALATGLLPDTQTITYSIEHADASDFSGAAVLYDKLIVQTGAGGAGAAAATAAARLPLDVKRYVRVKATKVGAANASSASFVCGLRF